MLLLSLLTTNFAYAYPPDNAAVLYYKHMEYFEKPDEAIWDQICNLPTSTEPASEEVKAFIEKYKKNFLIPELEIASELKYCDWGLDLSQGYLMELPGLAKMKYFTYLLLADGAIAAGQGDISTAIEKNLVVRRMAHHRSNDTMISLLLAWSMNKKSNEALRHILATHVINEATLVELKRELLLDSYQPLSFREPLIGERNVAILEIPNMTAEKFKEYQIDVSEADMKRAIKILNPGDQAFADRSIKYIEQYYDNVFSLLDKSYIQAFDSYEKETQKVIEDAKNGNDDAFLPAIFVPALTKCYDYTIRWKTEHNAMLNALDVYAIFQKTGKLPEKLVENSYPDCFSGKPFEYLVTKEGFTLRCRQEDLVDKKIQEYVFNLPK
jgi:hypothetical protein